MTKYLKLSLTKLFKRVNDTVTERKKTSTDNFGFLQSMDPTPIDLLEGACILAQHDFEEECKQERTFQYVRKETCDAKSKKEHATDDNEPTGHVISEG